MYSNENRSTIAIGLIMSFRMIGLFMLLPVLTLYTHRLPGATPLTIGLALGVYGLTQALLQIPFGALSDHWGRKKVITIGLVLFIVGSVVAALSHHVWGIIIGRAIQGGGAIGSTTLALLSDVSRDERRSRAMATIGLMIGMSFAISLVLGPLINAWAQLSGIFWITAMLGGLGMLLLWTVVPSEPPRSGQSLEGNHWFKVLNDQALWRLYQGIFSLHAILTAVFIIIPIMLHHYLKTSVTQTNLLYLGVLFISFVLMLPLIIYGEKKRALKQVLIGSVATLAACMLTLFKAQAIWEIGLILCIFFTAFTLLEASLPSLVSKVAPIRRKGMAMGVYSSAQFLGIFIGGSFGGWSFGRFGTNGVLIFCFVIAILWLFAVMTMPKPPYLSTQLIKLSKAPSAEGLQALAMKSGVADCMYIAQEQLLYCKIDKQILDNYALRDWIEKSSL